MKSSGTFQEERNLLLDLPGVLGQEHTQNGEGASPGRPVFDPLRDYPLPDFLPREPDLNVGIPPGDDEPYPISGTSSVLRPIDIRLPSSLNPEALKGLLEELLGIEIQGIMATSREGSEARIAKVVEQYGIEAFATYLPWHLHHHGRWGMYFFLEPLIDWATDMQRSARRFEVTLDDSTALRLAFYSVYRHELFHFHVEWFAVRQEVLQRKAVYLPYDKEVFQKVANTEDWLEEALAQATVLESTLVAKKLHLSKASYRKLLETEFRRCGPGYRDFECAKFGGPEEAHKLLAAQIVSASQTPKSHATEPYTPKHEYRVDPRKVPAYLVWNPTYVSRFQWATPKLHKVTKYLKEQGFVHDGPGPGDHERWKHGRQTVHVNSRRGECDIASLKAIARILNKPLRQVRDEIEGRSPQLTS